MPTEARLSDPISRLNAALEGRYTIEKEIGVGGMATVYLAKEQHPKRRVAIKVLDPEIALSLGPERFLREVDLAAKLTHPHILPLHSAGEADGLFYYVMPFVEGESLRDRLNGEQQLPIDDALQIAREVADALSYAHNHQVIHRDIKPENILLEEGHAVVADFGIARAISAAGGENLTQTGMVIGSPTYMSPEQAEAGGQLDGRCDIYSLGCVLYEMLAGEPPYVGPTAMAILVKQALGEVAPLTAVRPEIPSTIEQIVLKALAREADHRFDTASEFAEALASPGATVAVVGEGGDEPAEESIAEAELAIPDKPSIAVLAFENMSGDPEQDFFGDGIAEDIITDLSKISGLFVIARNSSFSYKGRSVPVGQIGQEMGVRFVLEGSMRKAGARVRITAQLVEASTGGHVWAKRFDRNVEDVFAVQDEITEEVVTALDVNLVAGEQARIWRKSLKNPEARELYYRARESFYHLSKEANSEARELFAQVVTAEPDSPLGYAHEAFTHWYAAAQGWSEDPIQSMARAEELVQSVLARDETNPDAHMVQALIHSMKREYEQAISEAERAIALGPNMADNLLYVGIVFLWADRIEEAHAMMSRAIRLCPVCPGIFLAQLGHTLNLLGRYEEAIEAYQKGAVREPDYVISHFGLAVTYSALGRKEEAHAAAETCRRVAPQFASLQAIARRHPFKNPSVVDGWLEALRNVGLVE